MKTLATFFLMFCFACIGSAEDHVHVFIGYPERDGPQGDYLLASTDGKTFSLQPISDLPDPPTVPVDEIIPALLKEFPFLKGLITVKPIAEKVEKLAAAGQVYIFGQVQNPGAQPADTLSNCITKAIPAEFASVKRISVLREGKIARYDVKSSGGLKLVPGDFVLVPMKMVFGN